MKMFLTGEGPTDCGRSVYVQELGQYVWKEGPVQVYIRKIAPEVEVETFDKNTIKELSQSRKTKRTQKALQGLDGHGIKAFFIALIASEKGYDITAMYVDSDKSIGSTQKDVSACQKRYELVKGQVLKGLIRGGASHPLAVIPMKMIECWILGDPAAFLRVFGTAPTPSLLKNPELIWGDEHNPDSDYPKNRLNKALAECGAESSQETFVQIAEQSDIETLCTACPISFSDFCKQLTEIISEY